MQTPKDTDKATPNLEIQLDDDIAQGTYVNMAVVNHTENEFTIDVIYVQPHAPRAKVRARLISSPKHTRQLMMALQQNLRLFEERYGTVEPSPKDDDTFFQ